MNKKIYLYLMLIFLACMLSISIVSAADDSTSHVISTDNENPIFEENINEGISTVINDNDNNDELILDEKIDKLEKDSNEKSRLGEIDYPSKSLSDLNTLIHSTFPTNTTIILDCDYIGGEGDIQIDRQLIIDGQNHILNGSGKRIFIITADDVVLKNIRFCDGHADYGGAIIWSGRNGQVINCSFTNNSADFDGGAINWGDKDHSGANLNLNHGANGTVISSNFSNNHAQRGGAIYWFAPNGTVCNNSDFSYNKAIYEGGAIFWKNGGNVSNSNFSFNTADESGGALYGFAIEDNAENKVILTDSSFINNTAKASSVDLIGKGGGAFYGIGDVNRCTFINNSMYSQSESQLAIGGGAIYFIYSSSVKNSTFLFNYAEIHGAAVYSHGANVTNCIFLNNTSPYNDTICVYDDVKNINRLSGGKDNWFGNTKENYNESLLGGEVDCEWLFLNGTANPNPLINYNSTELVFNFYSYDVTTNKTRKYYYNLLPTISLSLNSINGTLTKDTAYLGEKFKFEMNGMGTATVSGKIKEISTSVDMKRIFTDGTTFWDLNQTINNNSDSVINLDKNYTFNPESDFDFVYGVNINRPLILNGNGYTLDGSKKAGIFMIYGHNVTLNNILFVNGSKNASTNYGYNGGAIYWNGANGTVNECNFTNNYANYFGGAIFWNGANGTVKQSTFTNNNATSGVAIFWNGTNGTVNQSTFTNNKVGAGGVIATSKDFGLIIQCTFINNFIPILGMSNNLFISRNIFINNSAETAILLLEHSNNLTVKNNIFLNNAGKLLIHLNDCHFYNITDNWFGNNASNYDKMPMALCTDWLFLNATVNPSGLSILDTSEILFKLYSYTGDGIKEYNNSLMPEINLTLSSSNGKLSNYTTGLGNSVTFTPLSQGNAEVSAKVENAGYSVGLEVTPANPKLNVTVNPSEINYGENATLCLEYNPKATGTVNITFTCKDYTFSLKDLLLCDKILIKGLSPNEYNITVVYSGDENFTNATVTAEESLTVKKLSPNMEVTAYDINVTDTNGIMFTVSLVENATGSLKLTGDIEKEILVTEGVKEGGKLIISIENTGLAVGKYNVSFSYGDDSIYENSTVSSISNVLIIQTEVIPKDKTVEITARDESKINYTLSPSDAVGEITFSSNDSSVIKVNRTSGEIMALSGGIATVTISFSGSDNYTAYNATVEVKVNKIITEIDIDSGSPVAHNGTNATVTLKSDNKNIANEEIKVTIKDGKGNVLYNDTALTGSDGSVKVSYAPISQSPITITAVFEGSTVYNHSNNEITVNPSNIKTILDIGVMDTVVDGKTNITINITDVNKNVVEGTVTLSFNDDTEQVTLNINNLKQLIYTFNNTNIGKDVNVTAIFNPAAESGYDGSNDSAVFNVAKLNSKITADNLTAVYNSDKYLIIVFKDINGKAIGGVNLSVNLNGIKQYSTDENGTVKISTKDLDVNTYISEITFSGNERYVKSETRVNVTISPAGSSLSAENITIDYGDSFSIDVVSENATAVTYEITDCEGTLIESGTIAPNGTISGFNIAGGEYSVKLISVVDGNHVPTDYTSKLTVNRVSSIISADDVNVTYGDAVSINVSSVNTTELHYAVIGSDKKTVSNGTVEANGTISVKGLSAGKYTVEISFAGNENYTASSANVGVTVKKASAKITANAKTFKLEDKTKKYTVTLKNNKGKVMKNSKITLKVNGVTYTAKTNSKGVATFKLTKLNRAGTFTAVITYAGNSNYNKVTKKVKITAKYVWKTISRNSKDKAMVKKIQRALKNNHYYISYKGRYLKIDGIFHIYTEMAVKEFQAAKKLKVTGKVDYATAKKLKLVK